MYKLIIAGATGLLLAASSVSALAAASAQECQTKFQQADTNKDGKLEADEAKIYMDAIGKAQIKLTDASMITQDEFVKACQKDVFADIAPAATETQSTAQSNSSTQQKTTAETQSTDQKTATTSQPTTTDQTQSSDQQTASTSQPTTTEQTQTTASSEQALAAPTGFLASKLIGTKVYTKDDQAIGDINDLIVSANNSTPDGVIIGIGGFLGMGEKDVVVDVSRLSFVPTDNGGAKIVIDTTKNELETLPNYTKK